MTSSPGRKSKATSATCSAVVPLFALMACLTPQNSANAFSNSPMKRPLEEIQLVERHSRTYSVSRPSRTGAATGIRGWTKGWLLGAGLTRAFIDAHNPCRNALRQGAGRNIAHDARARADHRVI